MQTGGIILSKFAQIYGVERTVVSMNKESNFRAHFHVGCVPEEKSCLQINAISVRFIAN